MSRRIQSPIPAHYARALLASCPTGYRGVAGWLRLTAKILHPLYPDKEELAALIEAAASSCGRDVSNQEIREVIQHGARSQRQTHLHASQTAPWPRPNYGVAALIARRGPVLGELREKSPVKLDEDRQSWTEEIIDTLFPGNPLLCAGTSSRRFDIRPRQQWRGQLARQQVIVPSPVSDIHGRVRQGKRMPFTTGPRRFLAIEFTTPTWETLSRPEQRRFGNESLYRAAKRDEQAALLFHLGQCAPLAAVIQTGEGSLHGWIYCAGLDEGRLYRAMRHAVSLGANKGAWEKCRFVQMPDGGREHGKWQKTIYLNPNAIHLPVTYEHR